MLYRLLLLDADILHYIETELQIHYKKIKINKEKQWKEGEICIAQYHHDRKWYRGRIVETSGNTVQVRNNNFIFNYHFRIVIFLIIYSVSRWNLSITVMWKSAR